MALGQLVGGPVSDQRGRRRPLIAATPVFIVATSAFVLQSMNGLSPVACSIDFAANALAMTVASLVAARLAGRVATRSYRE